MRERFAGETLPVIALAPVCKDTLMTQLKNNVQSRPLRATTERQRRANDSTYRDVKRTSDGPEVVVALIIKRLQRQETGIEGISRELRRKSKMVCTKELKR